MNKQTMYVLLGVGAVVAFLVWRQRQKSGAGGGSFAPAGPTGDPGINIPPLPPGAVLSAASPASGIPDAGARGF